MKTILTQKAEEYEALFEKADQARMAFRSRFGYDPTQSPKEAPEFEKAEVEKWQRMADELVRI